MVPLHILVCVMGTMIVYCVVPFSLLYSFACMISRCLVSPIVDFVYAVPTLLSAVSSLIMYVWLAVRQTIAFYVSETVAANVTETVHVASTVTKNVVAYVYDTKTLSTRVTESVVSYMGKH